MRFEVEQEYFDEEQDEWVKEEKVLKMPEELKGDVGDRAEEKLNARVDVSQQGTNRDGSAKIKASSKISSSDFSEVTQFILEEMVNRYNRGDDVDVDDLTQSSKKKIQRHYFNQLGVLGSKKKEDE